MGSAIAGLHWTAEQFWRSTPHELYSAIEAMDPKRGKEPMTEEQHAAFMKAQGNGGK